jgi:hypothetical protein
MNLSAATFIRDSMRGGFCLFESMAMWLTLPIDEMIVLDLGSTDGTRELLGQIADSNKRVKIHDAGFSKIDAAAFADAANDCIALTENDRVLFWQADEIMHENLIPFMLNWISKDACELTFWRYQLRENFQRIKWFPHPVQRVGCKSQGYTFVGDGMNTKGYFGPPVLGDYDGGWFTRWGAEFEKEPDTLPTHQMLLDVSLVGAFRDLIVDRRRMHAPFWHEAPDVEGVPADVWYQEQLKNANWTAKETPFDIPKIMHWHLGKTRYYLRDGLLQALKRDETEAYIDAI